MVRVLVIGATGLLGRELVPRLVNAGHEVGAASRNPPSGSMDGVEWVALDLRTGDGLSPAVADVDVVINAVNDASRSSAEVIVGGTERLLAAAHAAGVRHLIYPSIVGIERVPFAYYRQKMAAEERVARGDVPWTIVRATQFHPFIDHLLYPLARLPVMPVARRVRLQPVDTGEVAQALVDRVGAGPAGRAPDFTGPDILTMREIIREWLKARHRRRLLCPIPLIGRVGRALRAGALTTTEGRHGTLSWTEWLRDKYGLWPDS